MRMGRQVDESVQSCLHLLQHDALGVGCASKGLLPFISQVTLFVVLVCPQLLPSVGLKLTPGSKSASLPAAWCKNTLHTQLLDAQVPAGSPAIALQPRKLYESSLCIMINYTSLKVLFSPGRLRPLLLGQGGSCHTCPVYAPTGPL